MIQPDFSLNTQTLDSKFGRFIIEPLPQGYGDTLGNSLRRVLYTSIKGAAITSVQIAGARHQFTTLEGVREDIVQLILALKQVRVSYTGSEPVTISLSVKGPAEVTAASFETPANIEIANPDHVIAHLTDKNSKLEIEATVETGFGYSPAEDRKVTTVGVIPIDASFTPVVRVNYSIEATRVGRVTNFDKLQLEITTDGTVNPRDAITSAAQTLVDYFQAIVNPKSATTSATGSSASRQPGATVIVEELDLPTRITNALQKAGFDTVAKLLETPKSELAKVKNLGTKSVKIIELALRERGFEFTS